MKVSPAAAAPPANETRRPELGRDPHAAVQVHLALSRRSFRWSWFALVAVHVALAFAALCTMRVYLFLAQPVNLIKFAPLQVPPESLRRSGYSFAAVVAAHVAVVARIVFYSVQARQLVLGSHLAPLPTYEESGSAPNAVVAFLRNLRCQLLRPYTACCGQNGYFGINGPFFDAGFEMREAGEIVLQTYQAYYLSVSIAKRWINSLAVAAIALNCCTTPVVSVLLRGDSRQLQRRVACRVSDMVLDSCCTVVIPLCIFFPYWRTFDEQAGNFSVDLYYDDAKYINAIAEGRFILITSLLDYISTLVPHVSIITCLLTVESTLRPTPARRNSATALQVQVKAIRDRSARLSRVSTAGHHHRRSRWLFVHSMFIAWGIAIVCIHLYAVKTGWEEHMGCKLHVSSWFTKNYTCSVMEVNCYRQQIGGGRAEVEALLYDLDRDAVRTLILSHCPALVMPPVIQEFAQVDGVEVFNCTVVSWQADAAISARFHKRIMYSFIMYSRLSELPRGLLHSELPRTFVNLLVHETNLTWLPESLVAHWGDRAWSYLGFERSQLRRVPPALGRLNAAQIFVDHNQIESLPPGFLDDPKFSLLTLSNNPLVALPDKLASSSPVFDVQATNTNIIAAPSWLRDSAKSGKLTYSTLAGTPFCDYSGASASATSLSQDPESASLCTEQPPQNFPVELLLHQRQP